MGRIVDQALARSRATLVRDLRGVLGRFAQNSGEPAALSRLTLGAQAAEATGDSVAAVAGGHA
jgi:hypothetical protein